MIKFDYKSVQKYIFIRISKITFDDKLVSPTEVCITCVEDWYKKVLRN